MTLKKELGKKKKLSKEYRKMWRMKKNQPKEMVSSKNLVHARK